MFLHPTVFLWNYKEEIKSNWIYKCQQINQTSIFKNLIFEFSE